MNTLKRWLPSLLLMLLIFGFSSIPSTAMPRFGALDFSIKKLGHALGYGLLALAHLRGLGGKRPWLAWMMAVAYAASDEFHQSFVPGRGPSVWDVLLFDNLGALAGLWAGSRLRKRNQKATLPRRR
jgi:VanZ family protein